MFDNVMPSRRASKKMKGIRLILEELEGRCLLSTGGLTADLHGNLWFIEPGPGGRIGELNPSTGVIQDFSIPRLHGFLGGITAGSGGNVWFSNGSWIDEFNPSTGAVQEFALPSGSAVGMGLSITMGPDGDLWFPFWSAQGPTLGQLDPRTGSINTFVLPGGTRFYTGGLGADIAVGQDGSVWFTETNPSGQDVIGRLNRQTGTIQELAPGGSQLQGITVAANGKPWFTFANSMGTIDPTTGQIQEFSLSGVGNTSLITVGPDGNAWIVIGNYQNLAGQEGIAEVDPSLGVVKTVGFQGALGGMTASPDGNVWLVQTLRDFRYTITEFNPNTGNILFFQPGANTVPPPGNSGTSNGSLSGTGKNVSALAGIYFVGAVASFTPQTPIASPGQAYQVTIDWGDGTTSRLVLSIAANGTYDVSAPHIYQTAGTYNIKVTIGTYDTANPLGDNPITVFSTATVDPFNFNMKM